MFLGSTGWAGTIIASGTFDNGNAGTAVVHAEHSAVLLLDGRVFVNIGANTVSYNQIFDPVTRLWTNTAQAGAPIGGAARNVPATLLDDGRVIWAGSSVTTPYQATQAMIYDPVTDTNVEVADLSAWRSKHSAWLMETGNILITSGYDDISENMNESREYDPVNNVWIDDQDQWFVRITDPGVWGPYPKTYTGNLVGANQFEFYPTTFGGIDNGPGYNQASTRYVQVFYNGAWNYYDWLVTGRDSMTVSAVTPGLQSDRYLIIAGGKVMNNQAPPVYLSSCELLDLSATYLDGLGHLRLVFSATGAMLEARADAASASLPVFRKAVVFGGHNDIDGALDTIEIYDSVTGTWSYDTTVMDDERYGHTVTRLNDGTYLIAGGYDNAGNPLETWEIWQR